MIIIFIIIFFWRRNIFMTTDEKAARLERHLLKTQFPKECEQLPFDALEPDELNVVNKCLLHQDLSDDEFSLLKMTLQKYRKYIRDYKPSETIEAMKTTVEIIRTEQELLDILDDESNKFLKVHLTYNGKVYELDFEILPVDDSRIVDYMQMNIDLFRDYNDDEKKIFMEAQQGGEITPEEQAIVEKMTMELNAIAGQEKAKMIDGFLASQLRLPDSSQEYSKREEFWKKFPFLEKWAIVQKVEDRLGLTERSDEQLFPAG